MDISESSIDREPIYAALGVREVWRYDGERLIPLHRTDEDVYVAAGQSLAFPDLPMEVFNRFLKMALSDHAQAVKAFRDWVRQPGS